MKFKLHDFYGGAVERLCIVSRKEGGYTNAYYTFLPGKVYETSDPVFIKYITGEIGDVRENKVKTADLESDLKAAGVEYKQTKCGTCAAAKLHLVYNPFKILEDENDNS